MLETVFLDAGGVLLYPNWSRISLALAEHGVRVGPEKLAASEPQAKRQLDVDSTIQSTDDARRGWMYFNLILTAAGIPLSESTAAALQALHAYHTVNNLWEFVPDYVPEALTALRVRGCRLVVVSNANGTLRSHMNRLGLDARVDHVLDSSDEGVEKPDPRIFEVALERSGAQRDTTIHVGDLYGVDVVGARAAGIRGVLLDEADLYRDVDCPRVRSLPDLVGAVERGEFD